MNPEPQRSVLVVEDNPHSARMMLAALEGDGYVVTSAGTGEAALDAVARQRPGLVLQDLVLPDMDGFELLRRLRLLPDGPSLPVVAVTGLVEPALDQAQILASFDGCLYKPVSPGMLRDVARAHLPVLGTRRGPRRGRVLVVDDDPIQAKLCRLRLEERGFEVSLASSGAEGLALARSHPPDAIVSDVLMPGMDGFRLCWEVRADAATRHVPVVLHSAAYTEDEDRRLAADAGAAALVARSATLEATLDALGTALSSAPGALPGGPPRPAEVERHARRVERQLDRLLAMTGSLSRRLVLYQAAVSLLTEVGREARAPSTPAQILERLLGRCLDHLAISKGAAFLLEDGGLRRVAQIGLPESGDFGLRSDHAAALRGLVQQPGSVTTPLPGVPPGVEDELLAAAGSRALLVVPLTSRTEPVGMLVFCAAVPDAFRSRDWDLFGELLKEQVGQAFALSRAVADLAAAERRYRLLFEDSPVGLYQSLRDGRLVLVNEAFARIFGYDSPAAAVAAQPATGLYAEPGRREELLARLATRDVVLDFESEARRADGQVIWISECVRAVRNDDGDLVRCEGTLWEITQRKQAQAALRASEERLAQAEKLAALGSMLAGVAHELNNPLGIVLGQAEMLAREAPEGGKASRVSSLLKAAERCSRIIGSFLQLARSKPPSRARVDLNRLATDALELIAYQLHVDEVEVRLDLDSSLPSFWADPDQLHQVVVNLVANAHQALRVVEGPRRIALTTRVEGGGTLVELRVADNGPGVPVAIRSRIFEPFFTTKGPDVGTGLGLSLCAGIVEGHAGSIGLDCPASGGSVFAVSLPVVAPPEETTEAQPETAVGPKRILVVDDEELLAEVMADMLAADGHRVDVAHDGVDALERLGASAYDMVLSDVRMPRMDGGSLYRAVRERFPELTRRFVFLTGDALQSDVVTALTEGEVPHLSKPCRLDDLRGAVARLFRNG